MIDSPDNAAPHGAFVRQALILAGVVLVLDQISKWAVLALFADGPRTIELLGFFNLVLAWNRGVSFGLFGASDTIGVWALIGLASVITVFLSRWVMKAETRLTALGLAAIIGGAVGNVIDRVRFGAVVDFLDVHVSGYHWPAFNVADSAITIGVIVVVLETLFDGRKTP